GFVWGSIGGWVDFHERVSLYTLAGALLIVGGCLIGARGKVTEPPEMDYTQPLEPSTVMVKAGTPMLNAHGARQWIVTVLRICVSVITTSDVAKAIPQVKAK